MSPPAACKSLVLRVYLEKHLNAFVSAQGKLWFFFFQFRLRRNLFLIFIIVGNRSLTEVIVIRMDGWGWHLAQVINIFSENLVTITIKVSLDHRGVPNRFHYQIYISNSICNFHLSVEDMEDLRRSQRGSLWVLWFIKLCFFINIEMTELRLFLSLGHSLCRIIRASYRFHNFFRETFSCFTQIWLMHKWRPVAIYQVLGEAVVLASISESYFLHFSDTIRLSHNLFALLTILLLIKYQWIDMTKYCLLCAARCVCWRHKCSHLRTIFILCLDSCKEIAPWFMTSPFFHNLLRK